MMIGWWMREITGATEAMRGYLVLVVAERRGLTQNEQEWSRSLPFRMLEM